MTFVVENGSISSWLLPFQLPQLQIIIIKQKIYTLVSNSCLASGLLIIQHAEDPVICTCDFCGRERKHKLMINSILTPPITNHYHQTKNIYICLEFMLSQWFTHNSACRRPFVVENGSISSCLENTKIVQEIRTKIWKKN